MHLPRSLTDRISQEQLDEIVRRLMSALAPQQIILFGSYATGVPGRDSDVDLMVLVDDEIAAPEHYRRAYACLRGLNLPVELHVSSRSRFERYADVFGSLQYEIRRKGILLYATEA